MFGQKILRTITFGLYKGMKKKEDNDNYFSKLIKENNNVSALNFFLLATLFVGIILLIVPIVGMLVDIFFNHTMTINLSDMALYIGAVAGIFASGGLTSAWTEFSYSKYKVPVLDENGRPIKDENNNGIPDEEEEELTIE
jgi:hypothetical protein